MTDEVEEARATMVEAIAATDDELTMKFLEDEPLTEEELISGLRAGVKSGAHPSAVRFGHQRSALAICLRSSRLPAVTAGGKAPAAVKVSDGSEAELEIDPSGRLYCRSLRPWLTRMSVR